jgi:hypothetical protein
LFEFIEYYTNYDDMAREVFFIESGEVEVGHIAR